MPCPLCGYSGPYNARGHPWAGEVTPSCPRWCRGLRSRPASKAEFAAIIDAFRPITHNDKRKDEIHGRAKRQWQQS